RAKSVRFAGAVVHRALVSRREARIGDLRARGLGGGHHHGWASGSRRARSAAAEASLAAKVSAARGACRPAAKASGRAGAGPAAADEHVAHIAGGDEIGEAADGDRVVAPEEAAKRHDGEAVLGD